MQTSHRILLALLFSLSFLWPDLSSGQTPAKKNGDVYREFFDRYKIPHELQREEVGLYLQRMNWQLETARKDDWRAATTHPARFGRYCDWSEVELTYSLRIDDRTKNYYLFTMNIRQHCKDNLISNMRFEGLMSFYADGRLRGYDSPLWVLSFAEKEDGLGELFFPHIHGGDGNPDRDNRIKWNDKGKIVFDDYKAHGEDFWEGMMANTDMDYLEDLKTLSQQRRRETPCAPVTVGKRDRQTDLLLQIPREEKKYEPLLKNCVEFVETLNSGSVSRLLHIGGFDAKIHDIPEAVFHFNGNIVCDVAVAQVLGTPRPWGKYLAFDNEGRIKLWMEGSLQETTLPQDSETQSAKYGIDGNGVEIRFHPTGYPACYKTIVRNRLFGRQLEWNEKGELLSDVDLDIPQPWPDAPKTEEDK